MEEKAKTIKEVKDFLNSIPDEFLDRTFCVQQENDMHHIHFLDLSEEDMYYDVDNPENGNMILSDWKEYSPETDVNDLKIGIPKGCPMIAEDF